MRDSILEEYPQGLPYKNFLITDPVRQQYVWRLLGIEQLAKWQLPLWNPYSFSGTPLLANFQSAVFYPLNILFFLLPINTAWGILVLLQPLLAGVFLYLYLRHLKISPLASFIGGFTFSFSGFFIAWLEWNTVGHVMVWLPLTLLSIEKTIHSRRWSVVFIFSLISSFFAGHLQVFFYSFLFLLLYLFVKILLLKKNKLKVILLFVICYLLFVLITSIQWLPTIQFISLSSRDVDQGSWQKEGWFIPWQNLIQFIAPDFFGNPATLNYWGVWNYAEFVGYIGIVPLIFALYAIFTRYDKKTWFFSFVGVLSLIMALPTILAKLPFMLGIPVISLSQPTRLMSIVDFSLSILATLGLDKLIRDRSFKKLSWIFALLGIFLALLWIIVFKSNLLSISLSSDQQNIAKRNLILPTLFLLMSFILLLFLLKYKNKKLFTTILYIIIVFSVVDLFRFGWKFTPFSDSSQIFPKTKILRRLEDLSGNYRFMSQDRRIMPPNFSVAYRLQDVSGYDPLYLKNYGQFISSWENNKASDEPASFNRILTPQNYESFVTDLLGVKYVLSLKPLKSEKLVLLAQEGETYLYENKSVYPRAYFVEKIIKEDKGKEGLAVMFRLGNQLRNTALVLEDLGLEERRLDPTESVEITEYSESRIILKTNGLIRRLLVLTDVYYPSWRVWIDGKPEVVIKTNYIFRGVVIPAGTHTIEFKPMIL